MRQLVALTAVTMTAAAAAIPVDGAGPPPAHPPVTRFVKIAGPGHAFSWVDAGIGAAAGAGALLTLAGAAALLTIRRTSEQPSRPTPADPSDRNQGRGDAQ